MSKRNVLFGVFVLALTLWLCSWGLYRFTHSITRDAFIDSNLINIAPQVSGTIVEMFVQEQNAVTQGQLLAIVDPSTYRREVELAGARLTVAEEALRKAEADLALLEEEVPQRIVIAEQKLAIAREDKAKATDSLQMITRDVEKGIKAAAHTVEGARARLTMAEEDFNRYAALTQKQSASRQRFQEATRTYKVAQSEVKVAEAKLGQAEASRQQIAIASQHLRAAQHAVTEAQATLELAQLGDLEIEARRRRVAERARMVEEARQALDLAELTLSYTRVVAPYDGVIAKKWRHLGDYAQTGEPILNMYNCNLLYVTANLEETLLEGIAPGNRARIDVDAYSEPFRGRVLWIGSATDAKFSLIPRDVSSGEFTYIVQRIPVRIWIERDERWALLKPGLSVTVAIEHGSGDPEWVAAALRREAEIEGLGERKP